MAEWNERARDGWELPITRDDIRKILSDRVETLPRSTIAMCNIDESRQPGVIHDDDNKAKESPGLTLARIIARKNAAIGDLAAALHAMLVVFDEHSYADIRDCAMVRNQARAALAAAQGDKHE